MTAQALAIPIFTCFIIEYMSLPVYVNDLTASNLRYFLSSQNKTEIKINVYTIANLSEEKNNSLTINSIRNIFLKRVMFFNLPLCDTTNGVSIDDEIL